MEPRPSDNDPAPGAGCPGSVPASLQILRQPAVFVAVVLVLSTTRPPYNEPSTGQIQSQAIKFSSLLLLLRAKSHVYIRSKPARELWSCQSRLRRDASRGGASLASASLALA